MTAPLTPPECDLQDFPFMPLHVARLRDSDLAGEATPEACWYAVLLWAASWHQLPAASLPDNDAILTKLLGLGRDVRTFRKHKASAMRGFVLCDDGRFYHPVVAEQAVNAWNGKLQQRWRTECARIKKANQRNDTDLPFPTFEQFVAGDVPNPGPAFVPEDDADCPEGHGVQEKGTGTGRTREKDKPSLSPAKPERARPKGKPVEIRASFPDATAIEEARALVTDAAVSLDVTAHAKRFRSHALAQDRRVVDWRAAWLGWIEIEITKAPKVAANAPVEPFIWPGPADVWAAVVARKGEEWARGYLGKTEPRDRTLYTTSATIERGLRTEVGRDLNDLGVNLIIGKAAA